MGDFQSIAERIRFDDQKLAKNSLFQTERFFCDVYCLLPGQLQKPHAHANAEKIYVVLQGEVEVQLGSERRILGPGEAAHSPPGELHGVANLASEPARVLVFMTPPA